MPYRTASWLEIAASPNVLDNILATVRGDWGFDCNRIVPMPEEIRNTASPVHVFGTQEEVDRCNSERQLPPGSVKAITREEASRRLVEYGADNPHDWAVLHWGRRDPVFDHEEWDGNSIYLASVGPPPLPAIQKLSGSFPNAEFHIEFFGESNLFWGSRTYHQGELIDAEDLDWRSEKGLAMAERLMFKWNDEEQQARKYEQWAEPPS